MRQRRNCALGIILISFGIGLFIASCFPTSFFVSVIAAMVILIGIAVYKN